MKASTIQSLIALTKKELHLQNLMKQSYKDIRTHYSRNNDSQHGNDVQAEQAHRKYQNTGKKIKKLEGTMKELQAELREAQDVEAFNEFVANCLTDSLDAVALMKSQLEDML